MAKLDSIQIRKWLANHGVTDCHISYLIRKDEKNRKANIKTATQGIYRQSFEFAGKTHEKTVMISFNKTLDELICEVESGKRQAVSAFNDYIELAENASDKLEIYNLARLINPFSYGEELSLYVALLAYLVTNDEITPFLYPWQNHNFEFNHACTPKAGDNRRLHFSDLSIEFQEQAIFSLEEIRRPMNPIICNLSEIWGSYIARDYSRNRPDFETLHPGNGKPQRAIRPKTLARYKKWYERLLEIKQECERTGEYFSENNAHEQIAGEEKRDTSTIDKGIRAYLATLESSEISENS